MNILAVFLRYPMYLSVIVLMVTCSISAKSQQIVTIDVNNETLHAIFDQVERQTGHSFVYDNKQLKLSQRLTIKMSAPLPVVLQTLERRAYLELELSGRNILAKVSKFGIIKGSVRDDAGVPLSSVSILLSEFNQHHKSDNEGNFSFRYPVIRRQKVKLVFSMLGRKEQILEIELLPGQQQLPDVIMPQLSVGLEEVSVSPVDRKGMSNSSLYINREVIEQSGALSLNDLLSLVPGKKIDAPSLQQVQQANLRSVGLSTNSLSTRDPFALNNSFGIAILMDGIALSNNSNMQTINPGLTGMGASYVNGAISGMVGSSDRLQRYSGDYTFGGTDLRQIAVDNIESVEIVAGVASAKYGDLTDGVVIVNRIAGRTPFNFNMQLRNNATVYGLSKGFDTKQLGSFTFGGNYTRSFQDNRDKLKSYGRFGTNVMWSTAAGKSKAFTNTLALDYGRNLDHVRRDPDDPTGTFLRFKNYSYSVSNRSNYRLSRGILTNIGLNMRYSQSYQNTYKEQHMNGTYIVYSDATETGLTNGIYAPGIYTSVSDIEGKPVDFSGRLDLNGQYQTGDIAHQISAGLNYTYGKNLGRGQIVDPSRPNTNVSAATSGNRSARYYDFSEIYAQKQIGVYIEDQFQLEVLSRTANIRVGTRMDLFEGYATFSPRTNINYELTPKIQLGLALGYGSKAPALAQLYPGPVYFEIPLFQNTVVNDGGSIDEKNSLYLLYVDKFVPNSNNLKPQSSQQVEFTVGYIERGFSGRVNVYKKNTFNGITTINDYEVIVLDKYEKNPNQNADVPYLINGTTQYRLSRHRFINGNRSANSGVELLLSTPKLKIIQTSFNIRGALTQSVQNPLQNRRDFTNPEPDTNKDYAVTGVYSAIDRKTIVSNATLTASTHIPKAKLLVNFTAEFNILNRTETAASEGIPIGYYTADGRYTSISEFDSNNKLYAHLLVPIQELTNQNQPAMYSNFHMNLSKEISSKLTLSFNVYNVFNYRPQYLRSDSTLVIPNGKPTYGAQIRLKL